MDSGDGEDRPRRPLCPRFRAGLDFHHSERIPVVAVKFHGIIIIKSVHKEGTKKDLGNQLFITNIVGKVVERILVERNRDRIQKSISPFQCGGIKNRSVSDNLFVLNCIMQLFKIRKQNHYILFTYLHKCFDKLWLVDAIVGMVLCGMKVEDAGYLYNRNKEVQAIVSTPAGNTEEIALNAIVKQGTVAGPIMAGVTTDKINRIERERPIMYYNIDIKEPAYVDEVAGIGTKETIEDMLRGPATFRQIFLK